MRINIYIIVNHITHIITAGILFCLLCSCEDEFEPEDDQFEDRIVIEGYIEGGVIPTAPYVIVTRTFPFFSELTPDILDTLFVNDVELTVFSNGVPFPLTQICFDDIPDQVQPLIVDQLPNIGLALEATEACIFTNPLLLGIEGQAYDLQVDYQGRRYRASTTIPQRVPLDSLSYSIFQDTLLQVTGHLSDPPGEQNFYRYQSQRNQDFIYAGVNSVFPDDIVNGESFGFPLLRGQLRTDEFDFETFGFFNRGDSILIKWNSIDQDHYNFWNTLEFSTGSAGPFSSLVYVDTNFEGPDDLIRGIWGGYANTFQYIITE